MRISRKHGHFDFLTWLNRLRLTSKTVGAVLGELLDRLVTATNVPEIGPEGPVITPGLAGAHSTAWSHRLSRESANFDAPVQLSARMG